MSRSSPPTSELTSREQQPFLHDSPYRVRRGHRHDPRRGERTGLQGQGRHGAAGHTLRVLPLAVPPAPPRALGPVAAGGPGAERGFRSHVHAPALPPPPAVGAAFGDEFTAAERRSTGAT